MYKQVTKLHNYCPTTAEKKLLQALLNPENRLLNISQVCNIAGVSRKKYYEALNKPEFLNLVKSSSVKLVQQHSINLIRLALKQAMSGSSQHWLVLLEMADLYPCKKSIEMNPSVSIRFVDQRSNKNDFA